MKNPMFSKRILVATMGAAFVAMIGAASAAPIGEPAGSPQARSGSKSPERASRSNKKADASAAIQAYPDATR
jgi:hypothetical protein